MNSISEQRLKDAELVVRLVMIVILLTAGTSKLFSGGGFAHYYFGAFQADLRIVLPAPLVSFYLSVIPFVEIALGLALIVTRLKPYTVYAWFAFMLSLLVGHYVLQEWSAVNQMLDYFFLGLLCLVLPAHERWRDIFYSNKMKVF
ncbi:MAG TPA: hypothetical protein DCW52_04100 [Gammaproteobacteria bacterium]|jgi:uncharacterized membrane protein YphA (DoxX/SURF4 family)|nr:hypothetical protein [Gammaproteobacteria bacterium]